MGVSPFTDLSVRKLLAGSVARALKGTRFVRREASKKVRQINELLYVYRGKFLASIVERAIEQQPMAAASALGGAFFELRGRLQFVQLLCVVLAVVCYGPQGKTM